MIDRRHESPAVAAIQFALTAEGGVAFLNCWFYDEFDIIKRVWPECTAAAFPCGRHGPADHAGRGAHVVSPEPWAS